MTRKIDLPEITNFIWRTARLLEQRRFAYLFLDGSREAVLEALRPYQNSDGGFGNGLEPDIRGPVSQPIPSWTALCILDEVDAFSDPMVKQICDYLLTITTSEGGVPFVLPSVRAYPRAPWWETEDQPTAALNPTAAIVALLNKHHVEHPWLAGATEYCWRKLDVLKETSAYEMRAILPFLDFVSDRARAEKVFARVGPEILKQKLVALTPTKEDETHTPLQFAPFPGSQARSLFSDEVVALHLDVLADALLEDGGWSINWYAWNTTSVQEWRGIVTIGALLTLREYGRYPA